MIVKMGIRDRVRRPLLLRHQLRVVAQHVMLPVIGGQLSLGMPVACRGVDGIVMHRRAVLLWDAGELLVMLVSVVVGAPGSLLREWELALALGLLLVVICVVHSFVHCDVRMTSTLYPKPRLRGLAVSACDG